jgi:hypothetical protein
MRIGDAIQLSRANVHAGKITLRTEKNCKRVSIPIHPDLEMTLEKIEKDEFYFWSGNGKVTSAVSDWHRTIERLAKDLNFRVHPSLPPHPCGRAHLCRHTDCPGRGNIGEHVISRRENLRAIY